MNKKIAVIGGGSWATALIKILQENVDEFIWYMRDEEKIKYILQHRRNPKYLSSVTLDIDRIRMTDNIRTAVNDAEILVLAIPSFSLAASLHSVENDLSGKKIISAVKGMIPGENLIIAEYLNRVFNVPLESLVILTGPTHAEEVALEKLSYFTFASRNAGLAKEVANIFNCYYVRPVLSDDIYGTEYAPVLKNIMAIAAGICHGLGYGDNFQAVLVSNAILEIKRFVDRVHPIQRDIKSSAYLGDLLVTAYSQFSRNRTFGTMIGKGYSVKAAQMEMNMVVEGYYATKCIVDKNKELKVDLPIVDTVYRILYENISPQIEMELLTGKLK